MDAVCGIKANRKVTRAKPETLAKILLQKLKRKITKQSIWQTIRAINSWDEIVLATITSILKDYKWKFKNELKVYSVHNIVPNIVRYQLATALIGGTPSTTFDANEIALGSGFTAPDYTDTQLESETLRWLFTNRYRIDNVAYLDKFFGTNEVSGNTFLEAGVFCDGDWSPNSGFLLSRIAMDETISVNETLTINATITITSAT